MSLGVWSFELMGLGKLDTAAVQFLWLTQPPFIPTEALRCGPALPPAGSKAGCGSCPAAEVSYLSVGQRFSRHAFNKKESITTIAKDVESEREQIERERERERIRKFACSQRNTTERQCKDITKHA